MTVDTMISSSATYSNQYIDADYEYVRKIVKECEVGHSIVTQRRLLKFRTERLLPKVGVMVVGLGGNNGTTLVAGILANKQQLCWRTKRGFLKSNWYGSLIMSSTTLIGADCRTKQNVYAPLKSLLPFVMPEDIVLSGWDINSMPLGDAMRRAQVLDVVLQDQLYDVMQGIKPLPGIFRAQFIANNQAARVNNCLNGTLSEQLNMIRSQIEQFKKKNSLDKVILLWTANTERCVDIQEGVHDTAENLLKAIRADHVEISPSIMYATAAVLENCSVINGAPQNTFVPGLIELAHNQNCFLVGDDFKTGQTKMKAVLAEFLIHAGLKIRSIVSYNHLGNNDGKNLSSPLQFRSKNISKSSVIDDLIESNPILYEDISTKPDHCVVIKYVPYVGDTKRALDEYTSEIFMNGSSTLAIHNTCEDSLLAAPIMLDLILFLEFFQRVSVKCSAETQYEKFYHVLSVLSYFVKAPLLPPNSPKLSGLNAQRTCLINVLLACLGLPPESYMSLEHHLPSLME